MTKKERVLALLDRACPPADEAVAEKVGCSLSYVRTCRQRRDGPSFGDLNYAPKRSAFDAVRYHALPFETRSQIYKSTRLSGASHSEAMNAVRKASRQHFYSMR